MKRTEKKGSIRKDAKKEQKGTERKKEKKVLPLSLNLFSK